MEAAVLLIDRQFSLYESLEDGLVDSVVSANIRAPLLLSLYDSILLFDERYRGLVYAGKMKASSELDAWLEAGLRRWAGLAEQWLMRAEVLEASGDEMRRLGDVQRAYKQARGILTPDDVFFGCGAIVELRDKALDDHGRGRTDPLKPL